MIAQSELDTKIIMALRELGRTPPEILQEALRAALDRKSAINAVLVRGDVPRGGSA